MSKALQIHLLPILMQIISVQTGAFLPERSIHHNVLLINKLIHKVAQEDVDLALLKLDMHNV